MEKEIIIRQPPNFSAVTMPFTPFHLGPALAIGLPLRRYLHTPTFILGYVIIDIEGIMVLVFGLNYPLHSYCHTFVSAVIVGSLLGFIMFKLEKPIQPLYRKLQLETGSALKLKSFLSAVVLGAVLHVLFTTVLYGEMMTFFPLTANPLLDVPISSSGVYLLCIGLGVLGVAFYASVFAFALYRDSRK